MKTLLGTALFFLLPGLAAAQQTVFRDPDADLLERGQLYFELDGTHRYDKGFDGLVPRMVWGVVNPLEVGLNLDGIFTPGRHGPLLVVPNAKVQAFAVSGDPGRLSGVAGTRVYIPIDGRRIDTELYGFAAWAAPFPLRLTAGAYLVLPDRTWGPILMAEWTVRGRLVLAAEWWRGRDLGIGASVGLGRGFSLAIAYLVSPGRTNDGITVQVGMLY